MRLNNKMNFHQQLLRSASVGALALMILVSFACNPLHADGGNNPADCPDEDGDYPYEDACGNPTCDEPDPEDECCDDGETVVGPEESCCEDISGSRTFGAITASFEGTLSGSAIEGSDFCSYSTTADLSLTAAAPYNVSVSVSGADVSWEEDDEGSIQNVSIGWSGSTAVGDVGNISCDVTGISATDTSGTVTFTVNLAADKELLGGIVLKDTSSGTITYDLSESAYDCSGTSIVLEFKAGDDEDLVAATASAALDAAGDLTVDFSKSTPAAYDLGDIDITVNTADINVTFSNQSSPAAVTINSGELDLDIDLASVSDLDGEVNFTGTIDDDAVTLTGTAGGEGADHIDAFGAEITGALEIVVDKTTLGFTKITGSSIDFMHPQYEGEDNNANCLTDVGFEITSGVVTKFEVGDLVFVHEATGMEFSLESGSYLNGDVVLNSLKMVFKEGDDDFNFEVTDFKFNGNGTAPTNFNLDVNIDKDPLEFIGAASWTDTGFSLQTSGSIGDNLTFSGQLTTDSSSDCNGLYVAATFTVGSGIVIPNTPLKVTGAGGEFGYNYSVSVDDETGSISESKSCGTYALGVALGISDLSGIADLWIRSVLNIGEDPSVTVEGEFTINGVVSGANGRISTTYSFWSPDISANVQAGYMIPANSGDILQIDSGSVEFALLGSHSPMKWKVDSDTPTSGKILNVINIEAEGLVSGDVVPFEFEGWVSGSLAYTSQENIQYPDGFTAGDCGWNQFGINVDVMLELAGSLAGTNSNTLKFNQQDIVDGEVTGSFDVSATNGTIQWPVLWGNECQSNFNARLFGEATFARSNNQTNAEVSGLVEIGDKQREFNVTLENLF